MAKRANMFASHEMVGIREDLADMIYNIDPTETPVVSAIGTDSAGGNTMFDWQVDSLDTPNADNAKIEGEDASAAALGATTRLNNYMQISDKVYGVTGTSREMNSAGRGDELDYQRLKKGVELRKDIEAVITGKYTAKVAGDDNTARLTGNLASFITTNSVVGTGGTKPTGDGSDVPVKGTATVFDEADLQAILQQCWTNGASPTQMFMPATLKTKANGFTGRADHVRAVDSEKVVNANVDIYVSEFGTVTMIPCRDIESETIFGIDPEFASLKYLRSFETNPLAKMGDSDREQMLAEYGLCVNNEKAHFAFYGKVAS